MKSHINIARQELENIKKYIGGTITSSNGTCTLILNNNTGKGEIKCVCLETGVIALEINAGIVNDLTMPIHYEMDTLVFLYCLKGTCFHKFDNENTLSQLNELQNGVVMGYKKSNIIIKNSSPLICSIIKIDKEKYSEKLSSDISTSNHEFEHLLNSFKKKDENYFYSGGYNLKIGEQIKALKNAVHSDNISSSLKFEGICHLILANQIEQFHTDLQNKIHPVNLSRKELKKVEELSDYIKNNPEIQHSIKKLCSQSTLSPAKLQEGFKFMHNRTVADFIRNVRVEKAEQLLKHTDLNISEIVYSIGFTSRSYFCRIFKNKYLYTPKEYKTKLLNETVARMG
ncbi:helix-turn-helix transcriptional regulator [Abyssalbus ytuae]|uniref:AraC family transcriptional regulator n=1 Tax=Abyssalbus ytuae TaxID=2926907 RepID=A0A9E6ZU25_9FLAO|nr:AraC family transcriptional regulator [Abyssalbus ytuae]UOB16726.1 AraC family transcriptional regulator [Abyssalbus ytuae]